MGGPFLRGDDFHPYENTQKMGNGFALTDEDRAAWVRALNIAINQMESSPIILACSALTPFVQRALASDIERYCSWLWLNGTPELIRFRLQKRKGHFMKAELLDSQFEALEPPENAIEISVDQSINCIISEIDRHLL